MKSKKEKIENPYKHSRGKYLRMRKEMNEKFGVKTSIYYKNDIVYMTIVSAEVNKTIDYPSKVLLNNAIKRNYYALVPDPKQTSLV